MKDNIELEFFKTFEIKPIPIKMYGYWLIKGTIIENNEGEKLVYPEITDRILLELICIHNIYLGTNLYSLGIKDLKSEVLQDLMDEQELRRIKREDIVYDLKHEVQALFKKVER